MDKISRKNRFIRSLGWWLVGLYVVTVLFGYFFQVWAQAPTEIMGTYETVLIGPTFLVMAVIGALIISRIPGFRIGWILCGLPLAFAVQELLFGYAYYAVITYPGSLPGGLAAAILYRGIFFQSPLPFIFLFLLFPTGRLLTPRWALAGWMAVGASTLLFLGGVLDPDLLGVGQDINPLSDEGLSTALGPLFIFAFILQYLTLLASAISTILRLRLARAEERQQLKWFVYSLAFLPVGFGLVFFGNSDITDILGGLIAELSFIGISVAIGIAIFRYRLYDIDRIINRTLVYGALSGALVLVYFLSVVLLQQVLPAESPISIVISTLAIAALFSPLRRRFQNVIDQRFYRQKYDAQRTLAAFSEKMRDEVELERLSKALVDVVEETMQPAQVSLWLKSDKINDL